VNSAAFNAAGGISLTVAKGEIFSLLGHDGAGKTITIKMLTGRARPTSGRAEVLGLDVATERDRIKPLITLVAEEQNLYERMTGHENLALFARLYDSPASVVEELLEAVGLIDAAKRGLRRTRTG
jgi:ABC-2 type transport system ATP-binding protein